MLHHGEGKHQLHVLAEPGRAKLLSLLQQQHVQVHVAYSDRNMCERVATLGSVGADAVRTGSW